MTVGSRKKVWWKFPKGDDHEWESIVKDKKAGSCRFCSGQAICKSNCLATIHPELAKEWHSTKNGKLTPRDVTVGSRKKIWWKCPKGDDHIWQAVIDRRRRTGCPFCTHKTVCKSNCLATVQPELAKEWHPTKNGKLTPRDVVAGSSKRVWWKCSKGDDHEWQAVIESRKHTGCPFCVNRAVGKSNCLATTHPELAKEWHRTKNVKLTPKDVVMGSSKRVWWKCPKGKDHEWQVPVRDRKLHGCPFCARGKR